MRSALHRRSNRIRHSGFNNNNVSKFPLRKVSSQSEGSNRIKVTEAKLLDFLKKSPQFVIPIYQRTYSWTDKECRQLWKTKRDRETV